MKPITDRLHLRLLVVSLLAVGLVAGPAVAKAQEPAEARGAALFQAVESGAKNCADLDSADIEAIGEFAMGRMLGSPQAHESMDQLATRMMGAEGLDRMHQAMGARLSGCGSPDFPPGFAQMMGMMPGMGGPVSGAVGSPMMGGTGYGPSSMMGGGYTNFDQTDDGDDPGAAWMAVGMAVLILGTGALVFVLLRRGPEASPASGTGPLDVLARRFAAGEISSDEYAERRRLLEGG